jgi:hypothetical protein
LRTYALSGFFLLEKTIARVLPPCLRPLADPGCPRKEGPGLDSGADAGPEPVNHQVLSKTGELAAPKKKAKSPQKKKKSKTAKGAYGILINEK